MFIERFFNRFKKIKISLPIFAIFHPDTNSEVIVPGIISSRRTVVPMRLIDSLFIINDSLNDLFNLHNLVSLPRRGSDRFAEKDGRNNSQYCRR